MSDAALTYELIKEIFLLLDDGDRRLLSRFNLTVSRFYALFHLGNEPGMSPNQLSELMFCDKSNITRLIKSMEAEDLVRRRRHESDGRSVRLFLTPLGQETRTQALEAHQTYNGQRFSGGVLDETAKLYESLCRLRVNLAAELAELEADPSGKGT
ncbi:MAG: MarR family transcriptional regulator [Anaerolineales bacterium]|nr:MarR family transcriptional regulator [Anaerolineales bacterium]